MPIYYQTYELWKQISVIVSEKGQKLTLGPLDFENRVRGDL